MAVENIFWRKINSMMLIYFTQMFCAVKERARSNKAFTTFFNIHEVFTATETLPKRFFIRGVRTLSNVPINHCG